MLTNLLDRLISLSDGSFMYSGPLSHSIDYFTQLGYGLPEYVNPAGFLVDLTTIDTRRPEFEKLSRARVQSFRDAWWTASQYLQDARIGQMEVKIPEHEQIPTFKPGFYRSLSMQISRTTKVTVRDPLGITASLVEAASLGIIAGWIFLNTDESLSGTKRREGALYDAAVLQE